MNSMLIDSCGPSRRYNRPVASIRDYRTTSALFRLTILLIVSILILFPERPAWGDQFNIQTSPKGISMYAAFPSCATQGAVRTGIGSPLWIMSVLTIILLARRIAARVAAVRSRISIIPGSLTHSHWGRTGRSAPQPRISRFMMPNIVRSEIRTNSRSVQKPGNRVQVCQLHNISILFIKTLIQFCGPALAQPLRQDLRTPEAIH